MKWRTPISTVTLLCTASCSIDGRSVSVSPEPVNAGDDAEPVIAEGCQGTPIDRDLISDFADASELVTFEGFPGIEFTKGPLGRGGISYFFFAPGLAVPKLSLEPVDDDFALRIEARPGVPVGDENFWFGFALGFGREEEACLDATGYRGVEFTLEGELGTCQLMFQVMISQNDRVAEGYEHGTCMLRGDFCYPPFSAPLVVGKKRTFVFPFTALSDGSPVALVDLHSITNVGWKFYAPLTGEPCESSLLLDDIAFFR